MTGLGGILHVLPPDLGDPTNVATLSDLLRRFSGLSPDDPQECLRLEEDIQRRAPEFRPWLSDAVARYADQASERLTDVDPRILTNFAYVEAAAKGVRGAHLLPEQGWRRELWTVAAGGSGAQKSTPALRALMQATLDFRIAALAQSWLGLDGVVTAQDHDFLIPSRGRFAWVARRVAHLLFNNSHLPMEFHDDLDRLWSYTDQVSRGHYWMTGRCESVPLSKGARALASEMAIGAGSLAGTHFLDLLTTRRSETHPYVIIDDVVLPARMDVATLKVEKPVFALIRRKSGAHNSALALEGAVRDVLAMIPGLAVEREAVHIAVSIHDPGETDVFATSPKGRVILGEVKAKVAVEGQATTDKSYSEGIQQLVDQLRKRRQAYQAGEDPRLSDGTVLAGRRSTDALTLGVTLHEYSGAPWRPAMFSRTSQVAPIDVAVVPVVDLQLVAAAMHDADDLCAYLETRQRVFSQGMAGASDEVDILCWYLRQGHAACAAELDLIEGKYAIVFSPKEVTVADQVGPEPRGTAELRRRLLTLPHAADW